MDELMREFAERADQIYSERIAGDYTWLGFLAAFVAEGENRGLIEVRS